MAVKRAAVNENDESKLDAILEKLDELQSSLNALINPQKSVPVPNIRKGLAEVEWRVSRFLLLIGEPFLAVNTKLSGFRQRDSDRAFSNA